MAKEQAQQVPDWFVNADDGQQEMTLKDFYRVIPYQRKLFFTTIAALLLAGAVVITFLPKSYQAQAEIMMEREDTFSSRGEQGRFQESLNLRMRAIIATLLSSNNVREMLESLSIINPGTDAQTVAGEVMQFKESVVIEFDNVSFINENTGREAEYSLGFTVSYEHASAEMSFLGAEELTRRLLNYSGDRVAARAKEETAFLERSLQTVQARFDAAETAVTKFKEQNSAALPHMRDVNLRRIGEMNRRILASVDRISILRDRLEETEAQLQSVAVDTAIFSTTGTRIVSPEDQLTILELEYAAAKNKYSATHPDIVRMEEEMAALRAHTGSEGSSGGTETELKVARQELSALRERYSDKHPDIAAKQEQITYLERQMQRGNTRSREKLGASNPVYNNLLSRKRSMQSEIRIAQAEQDDARNDLRVIEEGMGLLPGVEQELRRLEKVRDAAEEKYTELQEELTDTLSSVEERDANLTEKFVLLEAPALPIAPSKPNKMLLFAVLSVLSLLLAYAIVFIRHMVKDTILDSGDVEKVTKLPVFLIPEFE